MVLTIVFSWLQRIMLKMKRLVKLCVQIWRTVFPSHGGMNWQMSIQMEVHFFANCLPFVIETIMILIQLQCFQVNIGTYLEKGSKYYVEVHRNVEIL